MKQLVTKAFRLGAVACLAFSGVAGCRLLDFPPADSFPQESDVVEGDVELVSVGFFVDEKSRFYPSVAHLLGRDLGGVVFSFADEIELKNTSDTPRTVTVQAALQGFSTVANRRVELGANESKKIAALDPTFDLGRLYSLTSALEATVHLAVYQDEKLVALKAETVSVEPATRFRWTVSGGEKPLDVRGLSAVFVTPADPSGEVHKLLVQAAPYSAWGTMHGYQGGTRESALDQVKAVYSALKARHAAYAPVDDAFFEDSRTLKLPTQTLQGGGGNCVDGSLVLASAFEAMGMQPLVVFMKGHAVVGVRLEPGRNDSALFIETTMLATSTFEQAVNAAHALVEQRIKDEDPQLATVDVAAMRRLGIAPLGL